MFKRLLLISGTALVFALAAPAASAMSPGDGDGSADFDFDGKTASDDIWIGMCLGASLDLSQASQESCERHRKQRPPIEDDMACTQYE